MNRDRLHAGRRWIRPCLLCLALGVLSGVGVRAADGGKSALGDPPAVFSKRVPESIDDLKAIEQHVEKVLARVTPAIVCVRLGNSTGSGVVVTMDGYVLTAGHVSGESGRGCKLLFPDGKTVKGKTLGRNSVDAGIIKISEETDKDWPFVEMGSSAPLKPGDWCIARAGRTETHAIPGEAVRTLLPQLRQDKPPEKKSEP